MTKSSQYTIAILCRIFYNVKNKEMLEMILFVVRFFKTRWVAVPINPSFSSRKHGGRQRCVKEWGSPKQQRIEESTSSLMDARCIDGLRNLGKYLLWKHVLSSTSIRRLDAMTRNSLQWLSGRRMSGVSARRSQKAIWKLKQHEIKQRNVIPSLLSCKYTILLCGQISHVVKVERCKMTLNECLLSKVRKCYVLITICM